MQNILRKICWVSLYMTVDGSHTMFLFKTHLFSLIYVFSGRLVRSREILRLRSDYRSLSMWWVKYELKIDNDINNKGYALVNWNPHPPPVPGHSGGFDKKPKQMRSKPPAPGAYFWVKTPSPWGTNLGQTSTTIWWYLANLTKILQTW
jgi:hypothetical protein